MQCIKSYWLLLVILLLLPVGSAATAHWVNEGSACPSINASEFSGQDCTPEDICGDTSGTAQCTTPPLTAPSANTTSTTNQDNIGLNGGYIINCFATSDAAAPFCDNSGNFWCDRNETTHSTLNRETICVGTASGGDFAVNEPGDCRTNYFQCDGGGAKDDCEILAGSSCGAGTGTIQLDECFDASNGNCTRSSDFLDCNNDDSDNNEITCNGADGCEINPETTQNNSNSVYTSCTEFKCVNNNTLNGWMDCNSGAGDPWSGDGLDSDGCEIQNNTACTVGGLDGTISMCSGGSGNCVVDNQDIATTGIEVLWSGINPMLWLTQIGAGLGFNMTFNNNKSFTINETGPYWNETILPQLDATQNWEGINSFDQTIVAGAGVQSDTGDIDTGLDFNAKSDNSHIIFNFTTQIGYNGSNTWFQDLLGIDSAWWFDDNVIVQGNLTATNVFADNIIDCNSTGGCAGGDVLYSNFNNDGDVNFTGNLTLLDRLFLDDEQDHWFKHGTDNTFNGISASAFWLHHEEMHPGGTIAFLVSTQNSAGQNITTIMSQIGLNESAGVLGNSWMIIPNNLTNNLTQLSNCITVMSLLGIDPRIGCDTSFSGADLLVQDSIQAGGTLYAEGIRIGDGEGGTADFIMDGNKFNIIGDAHIRRDRLEQIGNSPGEQVVLLNENFEGGTLGSFTLVTTSGSPNEWTADSGANCFDDICAVASRISGGAGTTTIMEANISTADFNDLNLSFRLNTTGFDSGGNFDVFNVTVNNNTGSGDVQVYQLINGTDVNQVVEFDLPSEVHNQSVVSLRYYCKVNALSEDCNVDNIVVYGNSTIDTTTNVTRLDTCIFGADGSGDVFLCYNDTTKSWVLSPANLTADVISEVNASTINHSELANLDEDGHTQYLLADGTRNVTGDLNAEYIIGSGFNGSDWSNVTDTFNTFAELDAIVADKNMCNLDDAQEFTSHQTFNDGINVSSSNITLGEEQYIFGDAGSTQYIKFNATGIYIQS